MEGIIHLVMLLLVLVMICVISDATKEVKSNLLCSQCTECDTKQCPPSEAYPHMTAFDDSLVVAALQSDYVSSKDRGVYSVPNVKGGGESEKYNVYYGWESTSGSASGYHRFRNYMDKCSEGQSYLTVDKHGQVRLDSLNSLRTLAEADWKSIAPPKKYNHRELRFWLSSSTGKCLTVFGGKGKKRRVGVAECMFDGSNPFQLFAFRFHYHNAFCCCNLHNE
uniref:Uncharacterized protein n=1 Tax=Solanum tuberosum TaxID=4113 RepID=M1DFB6_SOLTU